MKTDYCVSCGEYLEALRRGGLAGRCKECYWELHSGTIPPASLLHGKPDNRESKIGEDCNPWRENAVRDMEDNPTE
jgi:hypothetical protein